MPNPSSAEVDSSSPDASATPSTSKQTSTEVDSGFPDASATASTSRQPSTGVSSSPPDASATSTSRQPPLRPPLSSIEVDPNNPPTETPSPKNEQVVKKDGAEKLTWREKFNIQLPLWREHIRSFPLPTFFATLSFVLALVFCVVAYAIDWKGAGLGIAFGWLVVCFTIVWLKIPAGPPLQCDKEANAIQPAYLTPDYIDDDPSPEPVIFEYSDAI